MAGGDTKQRINELESEIMRLKEAQPTLRDQFAMAALTGLLVKIKDGTATQMAAIAYHQADRMMESRNAQR